MAQRKNGSRNDDSNGPTLSGFILKSVFGICLIILILTLAQCTVKKPQSPTWDTRLVIPLINRTYPMSELINKLNQPNIGFDVDSNIVFSLSRDLDTFRVSQTDLAIGPMSYSVSQLLGEIVVTTPALAPVLVPLSSIAPLALGGTIPPANFTLNNDSPIFSTMTSATVSNGFVWIVMRNNLGIDLDTVAVTLHDIGFGIPLGSQFFPGGVLNGETDSVQFILTGVTISNQLRTMTNCHTPGGTILSTGLEDISTNIVFSSLFGVTAATAEVPSLSRSFSQNVGLNRTTAVYQATIGGGNLSIGISNNTPLPSTVTLTLPDFIQGGLPLVVTRIISANSTSNVNVDLTNASLSPRDSTYPQNISIDVLASSPGSGATQVAINQNQSFSVTAGMSGIWVQSVTGIIPPTDVVVAPVAQTIDVPQGFDSVQLAQATLNLEITNAVDLPGSLALQLSGNNGKTLNLVGTIARGSAGTPVLSIISDSLVANFLWPLPSSLSVSGTVTFGDGTTAGTLTGNDFIHARVAISAPFSLIVHQSTVRPGVSGQILDTSAMRTIADHVTTARLVYTLNNHLPLGARFSLLLNSDSVTAYTSPDVTLDNLFITAAPVNGSGIVISAASTGEQIVALDSADLQVLRNPKLWIASQIILDSTGNQPVKLTSQDYVGIVGRIEIDYRFDGKF